MSIKSFIQITLHSLFDVKKHLYWVLFLIALGIGALFFMITYANTIRIETFRRFHSEGSNLFSLIKRPGSGPIGRAQNQRLTLSAAQYLSYDSDFILGAAPEIQLSQTVTFRDMSFAAFVSGIQENFFAVHNLKLHSGRRFSGFDETKPFCLLGHRVYERLLERYSDNILGQPIHLERNIFRVIGVLAPSKGSESEYSIDETIFVPFFSLMQYTQNGEISKITLKANPNRPIPDVTDYIKASLERYLGDASIYEINNQQIFLQTIASQVNRFSFILGIVGSIALITGTVGLLKIIIHINQSRSNSLKLLANSGVESRYIKLQLIFEPLFLALLGGLIGVLLGLLIAHIVLGVYNWVPVYSVKTYCFCLAVAGILGLLIGLYPALSIFRYRK